MGASLVMVVLISLFVSAPVGHAWVQRRRQERRLQRELGAKPPLLLGAGDGEGADEGTVVRVTGVVQAGGETIVAPLSGRVCVAHRSVARVTRQGGTGALLHPAASQLAVTSLALPPESVEMVPFVLDCGAAGRVAVDGQHVRLALPATSLSAKVLGPVRPDQFLALHAVPVSSRTQCRFEETLVVHGARITVAGLLMKDAPTAPDPGERGFRDAGAPSLRLAGNAEYPVLIGAPIG